MRPLIRIGRVRLSHVETTDVTGQPARISWEHISGWPRVCRPSAIADLLHPGLPRYLFIHSGCSKHTIERLRERVIRKKFATGEYDSFWRLTPPTKPGEFFFRIGSMALLVMLVVLFLAQKVTGAQIARLDQQSANEFSEQFSHLTLMMVGVAVGMTAFLCTVISLSQTYTEPALAVRTTSHGFDRYLASGTVRFTAWQDAVKEHENRKSRNKYQLQICPEHGVKSGLPDWIALRTFLDRNFVTRKRRGKLTVQLREGAIALLVGILALSLILIPIVVFRSHFPAEPARNHRASSPAENAAAISIMLAFYVALMAWPILDFIGLHRLRLRIVQALRRPQ